MSVKRKSPPAWKVYERRIATLFRRWFPDARRGLQFRGGTEAADVVIGLNPPLWIECKLYKEENTHPGIYAKWYDKGYSDMAFQREKGFFDDCDVIVVYKFFGDRHKNVKVLGEKRLFIELCVDMSDAELYNYPDKTKHGLELVKVSWQSFAEAMDQIYIGDKDVG